MAVVKYDVEDVETGGGGVEPEPGLYPGKIQACNQRKTKADGKTPAHDLEVIVALDDPQYVRLWTYIQLPGAANFDNAKWKLREFTDALGLPSKGGFDPAKLIGKSVMVKTKWRKDDPERAEIKNLFKPGSESVSDQQSAALAQSAADDAGYESWTLDELKEEISTRELELPKGRVTEQKLIDVLVADDDAKGADDTDGGDGDDAGGDDLTPTDAGFYGDWSDQDLKDEISSQEITVAGRWSRNKAIEALVAFNSSVDDGKPDDGDGDAPDAEPEDDYDTWADQELKDEIEDRNKQGAEIAVTGRWTRDKAIEAMRADDQKEPF